jgi:hypothetical protein
VAINDAWEAVVVWSGPNLTGQATIASVRGPGGTFGPAEPISPTSVKSFHPVVAMDAQGDAVAVWTRDDGSDDVAEYAGYDADSPALRDVAVPPVGTVGQQLAMSARPEDAWAVGPPTFEFGDGASATGGSVSHSYSRPGSYSVGISAMDAGGARTAESRTILIKARNQFTIEKLVRNRKKGTATLFVHVLEPGEVTISGKGIRRASSKTRTGGTLKVPVAASGKALKRLKRRGKLKARLRVSYLPDGGDPNSAAYRLKLLKKHG